MKGLPRPWPCPVSLAFLCLLGLRVMSFDSAEAAQVENISTAKQLLALKEGELRSFVAAVEANARNCDALNGCSSSTCSRLACYEYGDPDYQNYSCLGVTKNTFCNVSGNAPVCMHRNFDFTRSYVRGRVDPVDNHIARTICTHRTLDDHFRNSTMNDPSHFFRAFFGAVDGTYRIYPGADEPCDPSLYDPRVRPWFIESTYIPKVVSVLIDSGLTMRDYISATDYETYISKAITTALSVLDTLTEGKDYVTIAYFDGDGIKQLMNATVIYNSTLMYQSLNNSLTAVVDTPSKSDPNSTHTNNAINAAISQLSSSNSIPATYLKVVIALIGGQQYENIADLNVTAVPRMNLFVYSFRKSLLPECNPTIRASLEKIPEDRFSNPLYALESYYSFLAKLHINFMKNQTDYGALYPDVSGVDARTLRLTKAAFGPNGELLGVLGIDFFEKKVEEQFPTIQFASISSEASSHDPGIFDVAEHLSTNVCFNHTDACPDLDNANVQGIFCSRVESPDINIGCCGSCQASKKKQIWPVIVGVIGGFVALVVICICIYCYRRRNKDKNRGHEDGDGKRDYKEFGNTSAEVVPETGSARVG